MDSKLRAAIEIFTELGWNDATLNEATTLPLGSKDQQQKARDGLSRGWWDEVEVDRAMLAFFAVRVGVTPRRATLILPGDKVEAVIEVIATKDAAWILEFIQRACKAEWRELGRSMSLYGIAAVELVTRLDLPVPEHTEYIKDWAGVLADHITDYPVERLDKQRTTKDALKAKFREHMTVAITTGTSVTGPLGAIPAGAVKEGWLTRNEALTYSFTGIGFAMQPGDRKRWAEIITEDLAATDEELLAQLAGLIPVISTAEPSVVELLGVRLLPHLEGEQWGEMALLLSYVSTAKSLVTVLQTIAKCPKPSPDSMAMVVPRLGELTTHKNNKVAKLSAKLLDDWGQQAPVEEQIDATESFEWRPYPGFQESPRVELPEAATAETITPLLAYVNDDDASSLRPEMFWAQLAQLCQTDLPAAKRLVAGLKNNSLLHAWAQGKQIPHPLIPGTTFRQTFDPVQARNVCLMNALGTTPVPCLLSQPSFEDITIDPEDLLARLHAYAGTDGAEVMSADLLLALARLRFPNDGVAELQRKFREVNLPIEGISRSAGELVADYLADPIVDPTTSQHYDPSAPDDPEFPGSLEDVIDLEESRRHSWRGGCCGDVSIYPFFTGSNMCCVSNDADWLDRIARFGAPLPPQVVAEILTPEIITTEHADALARAWERGLIVPGRWEFDDREVESNLAKKAGSLRVAAELGALAAVWPILDFLLGHHAAKQRVSAGVAELANLALELAPTVVKALAEGVATQDDVPVSGLAALAGKGGSSQAVRTAKKALEVFPQQPDC